MIHGRNCFDQAVKIDLRTCDNIPKFATGQGRHLHQLQFFECYHMIYYFYTTGCLLNYPYFTKYYKLIAIGLSKQQKLDADAKAIQQINFTGNLDRAEDTRMILIIEEAKKTKQF